MPASGFEGLKQTTGYYVAVAPIPSTQQFVWAGPTGAGGSYLPGTMTRGGGSVLTGASGLISTGSLLKDMGKTVVSSTHTYRKVQLVIQDGPSLTATTAAAGMPFYIELDTSQSLQLGQAAGGAPLGEGAAAVAYLPGLM